MMGMESTPDMKGQPSETANRPSPGLSHFSPLTSHSRRGRSLIALSCVLVVWTFSPASFLAAASRPVAAGGGDVSGDDVLTPRQWQDVDRAIDRGLAWLASQQQSDGSFRTTDRAQPGITSLAVMAFLARGHLPGQGPYGQRLRRAVDYVVTCQRSDGLLCRLRPESRMIPGMPSHTGTYNHAISGLMLAEVFGMTDREHSARIRGAIEQAIMCSLRLQNDPPKRNGADLGGWRYLRRWQGSDSDLSITSWHLMFLRSARNAGFEVSSEPIDAAMAYVERCFRPDGRVWYGLVGEDRQTTRAMVGAGILSLSLGGMHDTEKARKAGDWLLAHPEAYGRRRCHYNAFYATQGMHQLGGRYFSTFYPPTTQTLIDHQRRDGSWPPEPGEEHWGSCLTTSLVILTLATPYGVLPIFQR